MEKISVLENMQKALEEIESINNEFNFFNLIAKEEALKQAKEADSMIKIGRHEGKLLGLPVSVKDCICIKGIESRAASRILSGFEPTFDATVIERIRAEGAIIIGKTTQDEFGFGTFGINTGLNMPIAKNPFDKKRSCGGSSSGSAGFTAKTKFSHASIAESTGGSIACPAAFCGVTGLTPTYARVSRYGLIDFANSLDKIGTMAKTVADAALLLEVIHGPDEKDSTCLPNEKEEFSAIANKGIESTRIALIKELFENSDEKIQVAVKKAVKKLEKKGAKISEVSLPLNASHAIACYYLISMSEASTNLAKYCGMRYGKHENLQGNFNEYFSSVRSKHFGLEAKRRILLGTFARMSGFREAYYLKAMRVRTKLIKEFQKAFEKFDFLVNPTMPIIAPKFSEIEKLSPMQQYALDICTVPANLAGLPHISINVAMQERMPLGVMITANHLQEAKLLQIGSALEGACK